MGFSNESVQFLLPLLHLSPSTLSFQPDDSDLYRFRSSGVEFRQILEKEKSNVNSSREEKEKKTRISIFSQDLIIDPII